MSGAMAIKRHPKGPRGGQFASKPRPDPIRGGDPGPSLKPWLEDQWPSEEELPERGPLHPDWSVEAGTGRNTREIGELKASVEVSDDETMATEWAVVSSDGEVLASGSAPKASTARRDASRAARQLQGITAAD